MRRFVPSSPHFFRPVKRALLLGMGTACALAALVPAPLDVPANPGAPPNPARSAWFLLWIQELVSYHVGAVHAVAVFVCALFALPWLARRPTQHAAWCRRSQRWLTVPFLLLCLLILLLTVVAFAFRGVDWRLVRPF